MSFALAVVLAVYQPEPTEAGAMTGTTRAEETPPIPTSQTDLASRLLAAGLSPPAVTAIVAASRRALVLDTTAADEADIPIGASKVGGRPDLPAGMAWPARPAYDGAADMAAAMRKEAAELYADVGLAPPGMAAAEAEAFIAARKRLRDEVMASTKALMAEAGADVGDVDFDSLDSWKTPELARERGAELEAKAAAVQTAFPLTFVAQLDLAALSRAPGFDPRLPTGGRLLFFYDFWVLPAAFEPRAAAGWRIIYDESPVDRLVRAETPRALADVPGEETTVLTPTSVGARSVVTTIPYGDENWAGLGIAEADGDAYYDWSLGLGTPADDPGGNHQLGGWPRPIQSSMQSQAQMAANGLYGGSSENYRTDEARRLLEKAGEWRLVLQIGRDDAAGQRLPGALYVLMRDEDLKARRFDRAWVVYEQD